MSGSPAQRADVRSEFAPDTVAYNFEAETRIRAGFVGAGGHSYRNVYPTFQYAPVELVAVCDLEVDRAAAYARLFGAERHYADHRQMLAREQLDAIFIVTSYHPDGRVQAVDLALDALAAGVHVWMEKPTAATLDEVDALRRAAGASGRHVMTGMKKIFTPAVERVKRLIAEPAFGRPGSISLRYPQALPPLEERGDPRALRGLLDHIYHPASIVNYLLGPIHRITYEWEPFRGGSVTSIRFVSGAVGQLHLAAGSSGSSPLERLELVGDGANVVVENGVNVTYYRRAALPAYGRALSYLVDDDVAPLRWEPEFSLGQLCNKNLFLLGYVPEVLHFCASVLSGQPPLKGTLADTLEIVKLLEAYRTAPPGVPVEINPASAEARV
jgi:predicted dehydrogenase